MESGCLVSVIIPVFNVKPYLAEALDSVLRQTYRRLEIIIVDDGSADGSEAMCDEYAAKDSRVRVVHQPNGGLSCARNTGLDLASGSAIAFLDPDDAFHPDFIAETLNCMIRERVEVSVCGYTIHRAPGEIRQTGRERYSMRADERRYDRIAALRALADGRINVNVWNKLYARDLWKEIRFPEGHVYEDTDTTYRILDRCSAVFVMKRPLYLHRRRSGSISDTPARRHISDRNLAWTHFNAFIEANTPEIFAPSQLRRRHQRRLYELIRLYLRCPDQAAAPDAITCEELREMILSEGDQIGAENCGVRGKALLHIVRSCPRLLRTAYRIYHPLRRLIWELIGQ